MGKAKNTNNTNLEEINDKETRIENRIDSLIESFEKNIEKPFAPRNIRYLKEIKSTL